MGLQEELVEFKRESEDDKGKLCASQLLLLRDCSCLETGDQEARQSGGWCPNAYHCKPDIEIKADFAAVVKDKMKKVPVEAKVALLSVWRSCLTSAETCSREAENVRVGANHAHE